MNDRLQITGHLFYGNPPQPGPLFSVTAQGASNNAFYKVVLMSVSGNLIVQEDGFGTVAAAMEWAHDRADW